MNTRAPNAHRAALGLAVTLALVALIAPRTTFAQRAPLPPVLVALDTPEGERLLIESTARADFFRLTRQLVTQPHPGLTAHRA